VFLMVFDVAHLSFFSRVASAELARRCLAFLQYSHPYHDGSLRQDSSLATHSPPSHPLALVHSDSQPEQAVVQQRKNHRRWRVAARGAGWVALTGGLSPACAAGAWLDPSTSQAAFRRMALCRRHEDWHLTGTRYV
jgi:hypothetical protein